MTRNFFVTLYLLLLAPNLVAAQTNEQATKSGFTSLDRKQAQLLSPNSNHVMVVAHRACWRDGAPENGLNAVKACISMDVDMIEIDVRSTKDGHLVLMHDDTVDRTTNGTGAVSEMTFAQIQALRLRAGAGGAGAALTDERIPTFEAIMLLAKGKILVNLDAKADVYQAAFEVLKKTDTTDQIIMKRRVGTGDPVLKSEKPFDRVFSMPILDQKTGDPSVLVTRQSTNGPNVAFELIFTDFGYLTSVRSQIEGLGSRIWVNSLQPSHAAGITDAKAILDPDANWGRLILNGVDMIQTDEPQQLISYLEALGRRSSRK
jgi:glycerophosphoryl diester phosphodiesterase